MNLAPSPDLSCWLCTSQSPFISLTTRISNCSPCWGKSPRFPSNSRALNILSTTIFFGVRFSSSTIQRQNLSGSISPVHLPTSPQSLWNAPPWFPGNFRPLFPSISASKESFLFCQEPPSWTPSASHELPFKTTKKKNYNRWFFCHFDPS